MEPPPPTALPRANSIKEAEVARLIFLSRVVVFFFSLQKKKPNNFVCESLLAEGVQLHSACQAGWRIPVSHRCCWKAPCEALTQPARSHRPRSPAAKFLAPRAEPWEALETRKILGHGAVKTTGSSKCSGHILASLGIAQILVVALSSAAGLLQHRHTLVLSPCPKRSAPRWAPGTAGTALSPRCSHAYSIDRRQPRGGSRKKARPHRHQRAPRNPWAARCPWHCPPVPPERAPSALGRHGAAAGRAAGPWRGFPKKGLNSSFEFATSLTTPFPVRGCVRLLFFSLTFFFSLPSPCPPSRAMPRSRR